MRRGILLVFSVFLIVVLIPVAQEKAKDIIARTEDGRKVLLKADGTWEFLEEDILKEWEEIKIWKGFGVKKTESFDIEEKEWRICWETKAGAKGGVFQMMVYKGDSESPDIAANVLGDSKDCSYMRGKGKYWLSINATQAWEIRIEEKIR